MQSTTYKGVGRTKTEQIKQGKVRELLALRAAEDGGVSEAKLGVKSTQGLRCGEKLPEANTNPVSS